MIYCKLVHQIDDSAESFSNLKKALDKGISISPQIINKIKAYFKPTKWARYPTRGGPINIPMIP